MCLYICNLESISVTGCCFVLVQTQMILYWTCAIATSGNVLLEQTLKRSRQELREIQKQKRVKFVCHYLLLSAVFFSFYNRDKTPLLPRLTFQLSSGSFNNSSVNKGRHKTVERASLQSQLGQQPSVLRGLGMLGWFVHVSCRGLPGEHDWLSWRAIGLGQLSVKARGEIHHGEGSCLSLAPDKWV